MLDVTALSIFLRIHGASLKYRMDASLTARGCAYSGPAAPLTAILLSYYVTTVVTTYQYLSLMLAGLISQLLCCAHITF